MKKKSYGLHRFTIGDLIIYLMIAIFALFCILPMVLAVEVSLTDEEAINANGYSFIPEKWSLRAYDMMFLKPDRLAGSYMVSIIVTVAGTLLATLITTMAAFTLANTQVQYRSFLAMFFFITMVFNAGLVPWYMMCRFLGLRNNIFALIVPSLIFTPFNMFLVRNFMSSIPKELSECAKIDGARDYSIAFRIYIPLSLPVIATIVVFYGLGYWNNWFNAIMLVDKPELYPLQYLLFKLQSELQMLKDLQYIVTDVEPPSESLKMATVVLTVGPIFLLYPFLQRYFVKGIIIGAVKG